MHKIALESFIATIFQYLLIRLQKCGRNQIHRAGYLLIRILINCELYVSMVMVI